MGDKADRTQNAIEYLKRILTGSPRIYGHHNKQSTGINGGFYLSVFAVVDGRIEDITKSVAFAADRKLTQLGVYVSGGGHSHIGCLAESLTVTLGIKITYDNLVCSGYL